MDLRRKLPHRLVAAVPLGEGGAEIRPRHDRRGPDDGLPLCARVGDEAAEEVFIVTERESAEPADGQVAVNRGDHDRPPGQGCTTWRRVTRSTFA